MKIHGFLILSLFVAGCAFEEPGPMKFPAEPLIIERTSNDPGPPPEAVLPADKWKARLARVAPVTWTVDDPVDQLEAPDGWSRIEGGRGVSFTIKGNDRKITVWFFPKDWKGMDDHLAPVRYFGASDEWFLFYTTKGHEGWDKAEEAVARAFKVAPPRG